MNERAKELAEQAGIVFWEISGDVDWRQANREHLEKFVELIVRECINKIETYRIPVGNSVAGELACEWTYDALKEIRNDIKEYFGIK